MVFIDYGLSKIIKEEIGHKTFSSFSGSLEFVSTEMLGLFAVTSTKKDYVDLYYNDLIGLQKSIKHYLKW